jgi:hypothetical protein
MTETKVERFARVAESRTNRVLEALRLLSQCSNTATYEYSPEQCHRMFREIRRAVRAAEARFGSGSGTRAFRFDKGAKRSKGGGH